MPWWHPPPDKIEQRVGDKNDDKNEYNDEEKEAECLDYTSPDEMEEDISDKKMTRMKKTIRKKGWIPRWYFPWRDGGRCKW